MSLASNEENQSQQEQDISSDVSSGEFKVGQTVFCYHGEAMYSARIINIEVGEDGELRHLVHYNGWNKKWDEFVPKERLAHYNEENKKIAEATSAMKKKKGPKAGTMLNSEATSETPSGNKEQGPSATGRPSTGKKRGPKGRPKKNASEGKSTQELNSDEQEENNGVQLFSTLVEMPLPVVNAHQTEEQFHSKREKKLKVPVPEGLVTVYQLLDDWAKLRSENPPPGWTRWSGILLALQTRLLFNGFCHRICLTDVEMLQAGMMLERHKIALAKGEVPKYYQIEEYDRMFAEYGISQYYPVHHLVRLFTCAPTIFRKLFVTTDRAAKKLCTVYWADLAEYINERIDEVLLDDRYYVPVTQEDIDFIPENTSDEASLEFCFGKLAICKQKVDEENAKLAEQQGEVSSANTATTNVVA